MSTNSFSWQVFTNANLVLTTVKLGINDHDYNKENIFLGPMFTLLHKPSRANHDYNKHFLANFLEFAISEFDYNIFFAFLVTLPFKLVGKIEPRTSGAFSLPTLRSEGQSLTLRNRYFWFGGRTGPIGGNVTGTTSVLEFVPDSGWNTWPESLVAAASYPVVIPYNL